MAIASYFSWARRGPDSRASTPTPDNTTHSNRRVSRQQPSWQKPATGDKQKRYTQLVDSLRTRTSAGESRSTPTPSRALDAMQECFWIEDNLRRTDRQLDTCANRLDSMSDSASLIRQDLESLQLFLAALGRRGEAPHDGDDRGAEGVSESAAISSAGSSAESSAESLAESLIEIVPEAAAEVPATNPEESPAERSPSPDEPLKVESSTAQLVQAQETPTEPASYTTAPIQVTELGITETDAPSSHGRAESVIANEEDDILQPLHADQANLTRANTPVDHKATSKENKEEQQEQEQQQQQQQQTPRTLHSKPSSQRHASPAPPQNYHATRATSDEKRMQQHAQATPRSLQRSYPPPRVVVPPSGTGPNTLAARRASLKPVIGLNKVSQMTQFWSKMDGR